MIAYKIDRKIINEIGQAIDQIRYGEVIVTIHNDKVVQIEKREKKRFEK
ncbi:MAG: YezD family protein [Candidatus Omnitrophica bacterium]|nr:YezD family protein [Candidatus Omnitrophota bacterium]